MIKTIMSMQLLFDSKKRELNFYYNCSKYGRYDLLFSIDLSKIILEGGKSLLELVLFEQKDFVAVGAHLNSGFKLESDKQLK